MINGRAELEKQMSPCQPGKITRQIVSQLILWGKTMELSALRIDDDKGWPSYKFQVRICVILWSEHSRAVKRKENNNTTPSSSSSLLVLWGTGRSKSLSPFPECSFFNSDLRVPSAKTSIKHEIRIQIIKNMIYMSPGVKLSRTCPQAPLMMFEMFKEWMDSLKLWKKQDTIYKQKGETG